MCVFGRPLALVAGRVPGTAGLALTTNALLLPELASDLKSAGLTRINVHLDSLNPQTVERQMRWGSFEKIWRGIVAAEEAALTPIKLHEGATAGVNQPAVGGAAWAPAELSRASGACVRRHRPLAPAAAARLAPERAFVARTLLIHEYRRLLLRDPGLPGDLLPAVAGATDAFAVAAVSRGPDTKPIPVCTIG